jgi:hypothetical protein
MADDLIRRCLIELIKIAKENQKDVITLLDKCEALKKWLSALDPENIKAFEQTEKYFRMQSMPFDEDVSMQRFDDLIRRLEGDRTR